MLRSSIPGAWKRRGHLSPVWRALWRSPERMSKVGKRRGETFNFHGTWGTLVARTRIRRWQVKRFVGKGRRKLRENNYSGVNCWGQRGNRLRFGQSESGSMKKLNPFESRRRQEEHVVLNTRPAALEDKGKSGENKVLSRGNYWTWSGYNLRV